MREDLKLRIKWGSAVISVSTPWIMKIRVNITVVVESVLKV